MKKILSIILTLALMLSVMGAIPAMAAISDEGVIFSFDGNATSVNGWGAAGTGYGAVTADQAGDTGKQADDVYALATVGGTGSDGSTVNEFRWNVANGVWDTSDRQSYSYLVLTAQIKPASSITDFRWTRNSGSQNAHSLSVPNKDTTKIVNNWNVGKWNTITTVYAFGGDYTTTTADRVAKTYVNGVLVDTNSAAASLETNNDRLQMHVFGPAGTTFGIDNVKYYMTTTEYVPTAPSIAAGTGYTVSGSAISINPGDATAVSALTASTGASVKVYADSTFAAELATTDVIPHGAVAVVSQDNQIIYYDVVKATITDTILKTDGTKDETEGNWYPADKSSTFDSSTGTTAYGTMVHSKDGVAAKSDYYSEVTLDSTNEEFRWFIEKSTFEPDDSKYSYLVMSAQIMPYSDSGITGVVWKNRDGTLSLAAKSGNYYTNNLIAGALNIGQWNTVTTVYCYDEVLENPTTAYKKYKAETYVNGKIVSTITDANSVMTADVTTTSGNRDNNRIQLDIWGTGGKSFGLDNIHIYQTNAYPDVTMPALAAGTNYTIEGNALKVHKDTAVAVGELTGANVWNGEITSQLTSGNLAAGNVVTVENGDKISYYTVETNYEPGIYSIASYGNNDSTDASFAPLGSDSTTVITWEQGIGGKAEDNPSAKVSLGAKSADDSTGNATIYYETGWMRNKLNMDTAKYLVFEMNVFPSYQINNFWLGSQWSYSITDDSAGNAYYFSDGMATERWNKIMVVLDVESGNTKSYINGVLVNDSGENASIFGAQAVNGETIRNCSQLRIIANAATYENQYIYLDDLRIYESEAFPEITSATQLEQNGFAGNFVINNDMDTLILPAGTTAEQTASALAPENTTLRVVNKETNKTAASSAEVAFNNLIVIENSDNDYKYYTVTKVLNDYDIVFGGEAYKAEYNEVVKGKLTPAVYLPEDSSVQIIAAQYSQSGALYDADIIPLSGSGLVQADAFSVAELKGSSVKAFVFDSIKNLVPLAKNSEASYEGDALKILCIGSSYGVDGTRYVQQMAKSAGKKVVIANLYKGGGTLQQHWENASGDIADYIYYKNSAGTWEHRKDTTLEYGIKDEDWDIIVMQNSAAKSDEADTYQPYLENLIEYVQSKKTNDNCKFYWHMTWAYHDGSSHLENGETSETVYNNIISAVKSQIIAEGTYEDFFADIIPSGTAVQNVRTLDAALGEKLRRDDTCHLSYDYGRYLTGLVWTATLTGADVDDITWTPAELDYDGFSSSAEDSANAETIRKAVKAALNNHYELISE